MRLASHLMVSALFFALTFMGVRAIGADSALDITPNDVMVVGVVHDLSDANQTVGALAKLVGAPAPDLLNIGKMSLGSPKGIDEQRDLAIVLTSVDFPPAPLFVVPVSSSDAFFAAIGVKPPENGAVVDARIQGMPSVVGLKGKHAVLAAAGARESMLEFLKEKPALAADPSLGTWADTNKASIIVTSRGIKELLPKFVDQIRATQAAIAGMGGPQGPQAAEVLNMYINAFTTAQTEVDRFGVGLRVNADQDVDLVSWTQLKPGGSWARRLADAKPCSDDLVAGVPSGPFVIAGGVVFAEDLMQDMMQMSVAMMKSQTRKGLSPEQEKKIVDSFGSFVRGVRSIGMRMGPSKSGEGLYGDMAMVLKTDDPKKFLEQYEQSVDLMNALSKETKHPYMPTASSRHVDMDGADVLEVTMDMPNLEELAAAGGPDPVAMRKLMFGPDGKIKHYVAMADADTVLTVYTSLEKLRSALESFRAKKGDMTKDAGVSRVSAMLPAGSQAVVYVSVGGYAAMIRQFMASVPGAPPLPIPEFPECSPIGLAMMASPNGVETHMVIPADVPKTVAEAIQKWRATMGSPVPRGE